jgi:transcriptional repressor NF-X1
VHSCPCGKHTLDTSSTSFFPANSVLQRSSCSDPIPTCSSICAKPLDGCSHLCASKCHTGSCPPCSVKLIRPCRCGSTTHDISCADDQARAQGELRELLCDKPCPALRACGRHQCNRTCCPLASIAATSKGKGKKKAVATTDHDAIVDDAGWHTCDLVCGKTLTCGNHTCEEPDHRGYCPPCLRSSFEEMICNCGQTILEPPIPCGTRMSCRYPCARPPPSCGHPKAQHACHEDPIPCPPCPFLTTKQCACGKKMVPNVRCSQEKVPCGTPCGK